MSAIPLIQPAESTMAEFERAELLFLRWYWMTRWNLLKNVHPITV